MDIQRELTELRQRVMLLEGGNTTFQSELSNQIKQLREVIMDQMNEKLDKLINYLQAWVGVGNVNMDDIKEAVNQ